MTTPVGTTDTTRRDDLWARALEELRLQMPKTTFDTWLKGTTAQLDGSTLTIFTRNGFGLDWLDHRLRPKIEATVANVAGQSTRCPTDTPQPGQPLTIAFAVSGSNLVDATAGPHTLTPEPEIEHYEIWAPADPTVLRILPDLAVEIGLNESIVLLQIGHWIKTSHNVRHGRRWTYQSSRQMCRKAFRWWSKNTVRRAVASLHAQDLIFVTDQYNQREYDRTPWFALNPAGFRRLHGVELKRCSEDAKAAAHYEIWAPADPTVLRILPDLATEIGLNQSIVLLQLDYWIRDADHVRAGRRWTYRSVRDMQRKAFRWWSLDTINRTIQSLIAQRLIFATDQHNHRQHDRTRWFALNPKGFQPLQTVELKPIDA